MLWMTNRREPAPIIHLVHGTWANFSSRRGAPKWFEVGHAFRDFLDREFGSSCEIRPFEWGWGANLETTRVRAVRKLEERLETYPVGTKHILIGHSHGGNICARTCAREMEGRRERYAICLATPFLIFRKVTYLYRSLLAWGRLVAIALFFFLLSTWQDHTAISSAPWWQWILACLIALAFMLLTEVTYHLANFAQSDLALPQDSSSLLIVRATGDEASGVLQFLAPISLLSNKLSTFTNLTSELWAKSLARTWEFNDSLGGLFVIATFFAVLVGLGISYEYFGPVALKIALTALILFIAAFPLQLLLRAPFGWDLFLRGLRFSVSAEPTPPGRWEIEVVESEEGSANMLAHSSIYENRRVHALIRTHVSSLISE